MESGAIFRRLCDSAHSQSFGNDERFETSVILFLGSGDDTVGVFRPVAGFLDGVFHAQFDDFRGVRASAGQASEKFLFVGGHDEEIDQGAAYRSILTFADELGALDIEVHHDIATRYKVLNNLRTEGAVEVPMNLGAFQKFAILTFCEELVAAEKMVILSIRLARTWRAGGAGDRVMRLVVASQASAQGGFTRARWPGDHQ